MEIAEFEFDNIKAINFTLLSNDSLKEILSWRNSEEVRKWMYNDKIIFLEEHLGFVNSLKSDNKNLYLLIQNEENEGIGVIYFNRINHYHKNAFLGIYSNPFIKKNGMGKLLSKSFLNIGFAKLDLHTLKLEVLANNEKAIRFYKKNGFSIEGTLKEFVHRDNYWIDVIIMGKMKNNLFK